MQNLKVNFTEGDKVYIKAGETIWNGVITEVLEDGIWLTEDKQTEEFISFADLQDYEWAVE